LLGRSLAHKYAADSLLSFADEKGILGSLSSLGSFTLKDAAAALRRECGYALDEGVRARMLKVLIDFLCECGLAAHDNGCCVWRDGCGNGRLASAGEMTQAAELFRGQVDFFDRCLAYADVFLRGGDRLFGFDAESAQIWENFLGNAEFNFGRSVLAQLMFSSGSKNPEVLDLCCGPGFDIIEIQNNSAGAIVTVLDFKDVFRERVLRRAPDPEAVRWIDSGSWAGFGTALPFAPEAFDAVFFACADPYIPEESREFVYSDIFRVIRPGGSLNILSHSYPDPEQKFVDDPWIRKGTLCHDFAESVCEGWHGFYDAAASCRLFESIGFRVTTIMMNASIWRLDKL